ncbi:Hypothetical predicted protein [Podarcis lilfordi]|uniref:Uncharacterized protein n=1 Tax=Podarcis lilfordi TaxID=74358 RepID=A0AA35PIB4_9SAUR|nr:Hypothetical predicted protein [Podarcis lilfordi]
MKLKVGRCRRHKKKYIPVAVKICSPDESGLLLPGLTGLPGHQDGFQLLQWSPQVPDQA